MTTSSPASILLIGATGRDGLAIIQKLITHPTSPQIHVFLGESSQLCQTLSSQCASVYVGDCCRATDVLKALQFTEADIVILSTDAHDKEQPKVVRTRRAWAVVSAMKMPGMEHVRAVVLSSAGAGTSRINIGMGYGRLMERRLRHVLKDHTGQELAFLTCGLHDRTLIVRATALTDKQQAGGHVVEFGDKERFPSFSIARGDLALYITKQVCDSALHGKIVNITGKQQYEISSASTSSMGFQKPPTGTRVRRKSL